MYCVVFLENFKSQWLSKNLTKPDYLPKRAKHGIITI